MMRFGFSIYDTFKKKSASAQSVLVVANAADAAVNNKIPLEIAENWQANGLKHLEKYESDMKYKLIHDIIDPDQKEQNVAVTYPILLDLLAKD